MSIVKYNSLDIDESFKTLSSVSTSLNNAISCLGGCYGAESGYVNISESINKINSCKSQLDGLNSWLSKTNTDVTNALNSFKNDYDNLSDAIIETRKNIVNFK